MEKRDKDYISELGGYVKTTDQKRWLYHFKKHLVRTVACALNDGIINKQCLTLTGGQDCGKSYFCRFLCPPKLKEYYAENIQIDKDSLIALSENFIINLDELSTLSKADITALKSYFSKDYIKVRRPYDATTTRAPRVTSFVGSTNEDEFLTDTTGNVRWLCFDVTGIDWAYSKVVDIDLVWSQAYSLLRNDFKYQLNKEDVRINDEANKKYQVSTPEMELVAKIMKPLPHSKYNESNPDHRLLTATQIIALFSEDSGKGQRLNKNRLGKALRYFGFEQITARLGNNSIPIKVWVVEYNREQDFKAVSEGGVELNKDGYPASWDSPKQGEMFDEEK